MSKVVAGYAQTLLRAVLEGASSLTGEQFAAAGMAARRLLLFAWDEPERSSWLVTNALRAVCQTFASDPGASATLLRRAIEPRHLAAHGYEEMPVVTRELRVISDSDPGFVADLYAAVFTYEEPSTDTTDMSGSQILSLTSNKKQDYDHSQWELAEFYPTFLEEHLVLASHVLVQVVDAYRSREHSTETPPEKFTVNGVEAELVHDFSCIWDEGFASHTDDEVRILDAFFRHLEHLTQAPEMSTTLNESLQFMLQGSRSAVIWRRFLQLGAQHPREIGLKIKPLAWSVPLMWVPDTENPASAFIAAVFPLLSLEERERVEKAIVSLPESVPERIRDAAKRDRGRLLAPLAHELTTERAKQLLHELQAAGLSPDSQEHFPRLQVWADAVDEKTYVEKILGVSTSSEPHAGFLDVYRPVQAFGSNLMNKVPSAEEIEGVLPHLRSLHAALIAPPNNVDERLLTMAAGSLAAACKTIANVGELSCETSAGNLAQKILLELSVHPSPEHDPAHDAAFDKHPSWGAPLARIEAAVGLMALARHSSCCSAAVLDSIDRLARDAAPEVRYQIASNLTLLYHTAPERMWKLVESRATSETSNGVLMALAHSIQRLVSKHLDEAAKLTQSVFEQVPEGPGAEDVQRICVGTFLWLHIWRNHQASQGFVYGLCQDVPKNHDLLNVMMFELRGPLIHGDPEHENPEAEGVRSRAIHLFNRITLAACDALSAVLTESRNDAGPKPDRETVKSLAHLVDNCARQLYFASGAFRDPHATQQISRAQQRRFYHELVDTIDRLSTFGFASTVHHLIEMLQLFIAVDPKRVFLQVAALVESGKRGSYQYESMAVGEIVKIVERYIAEYRSLLQEDAHCRVALRNVLDSFVEAGWPAAQRLSYRLDDIFR